MARTHDLRQQSDGDLKKNEGAKVICGMKKKPARALPLIPGLEGIGACIDSVSAYACIAEKRVSETFFLPR